MYTRVRNRCSLSGRPRGFIRKFGVSRITFRELALNALGDDLAMDMLRTGFQGKPRRHYLAADPAAPEFRSSVVTTKAGLRA